MIFRYHLKTKFDDNVKKHCPQMTHILHDSLDNLNKQVSSLDCCNFEYPLRFHFRNQVIFLDF